MMARDPRIVAELGRPETPDETAARKAESSRVYRASQNTRNLIAALLVTLAVVAVIIFAVPRGEPPAREPIDVAAVAQDIEAAEGRTVIVPDVPDEWIVNRAAIEGDSTARLDDRLRPRRRGGLPARRAGLRRRSGLDDAGAQRRRRRRHRDDRRRRVGSLRASPTPLAPGNISGRAVSTQAGDDTILVYGSTDDETLEQAAASVADQVLRAPRGGP